MKTRSDFTEREWQRILRSANKFAEYLANRLAEQECQKDSEPSDILSTSNYRSGSLRPYQNPQARQELTLSHEPGRENKRSRTN
jgi:hypothetical protein